MTKKEVASIIAILGTNSASILNVSGLFYWLIKMRKKPNTSLKKRAYADSVINQQTGQGVTSDRLLSNMYLANIKDNKSVYTLYESNWLAQNIVENLASDTTSKWRRVQSTNQNLVKTLEISEIELGLQDLCANLTRELYVFGVVYAMLITNASDVLDSPMQRTEDVLKVVILKKNSVNEDQELVTEFNEFFGTPKYFNISTSSGTTKIHYSRIVKITDRYKSPSSENKNNYIGTLATVYDDVMSYTSIMSAVDTLITDASIATLQSTGLNSLLAQANGQDKVREYFADAMINKSIYRTTIIDANDVLSRMEVGNLAGIATIIDKKMEAIACATRQSLKRLFGLQSKGLSNDQNVDDGWFAYCHSWQVEKYQPLLSRVENQILQANRINPDYEVEWLALDEVSQTEKLTQLKTASESIKLLVDSGVVQHSRAAQILVDFKLVDIPENEIEDAGLTDLPIGVLNNGNNNQIPKVG